MNLTTFKKKCICGISVVTLIAFCVVLVIILILMTKSLSTSSSSIRRQNHKINETKNLNNRTYLQDLASDIEYVTPEKISTMLKSRTPDKLNFSNINNKNDFPPLYVKHDSGHFRDRFKSKEWDYRPRYRIYAFGRELELELQHDDTFISPNLNINYKRENHTERIKHDSKTTLRRCYYSGMVKNDPNSAISVSLCNGMIGIIKTSNYTYYIEPDKAHTLSSPLGSDSFLHRIKRLPHNDMENDIHSTNTNEQDSYEFNNDDQVITSTNQDNSAEPFSNQHQHIINKRHSLFFDDMDEKLAPFRSTREADYSLYIDDRKSNTYFIKILVVVDKSMIDFHQSSQVLEHYLLVLMSYAARLYKDPSIGNSLSLTVASIWMLDEIEFTSLNSQDMLRKFCEWQQANRHMSDQPQDMALLLTRNRICRRNSTAECDTLGLAEVGSMCNPSSGCAIVKENGLSTSYTIAHEVGHVLNMPHDNTASCQKFNRNSYNNIMTKVMNNGTKPRSWSECSKHYLSDFLLSYRAKCLIEPPETNFITSKFTQNLPGENFTIDRQCELEFGHSYRGCTFSHFEACKMLWCTNDENSGCTSNKMPWADGTVCGPNQWCNQNECTSRKLLAPVAGGWGPWQGWSECSRTCGGGVKYSKRLCNAPLPQNGGQYCPGYGVRYESCNTADCDADAPDFRSVQCARFNGITKNYPNLTGRVEWLAEYSLASYDVCKLYCRPKTFNVSYLLKEKVIDGTKCGLNSFDICIDGYCKKGGCDNKLYSNITFDDCGVCGGDNSKCQHIFGKYNKIEPGYRRVTEIPYGSFNLNIKQNAKNDTNYLVLKDIETGEYILNSETMISPQEKDFIYADVNISYSGSSAIIETITTPKNHKLTKTLELGVLSVGDLQPPNITFGYTMNQDYAPKFGWRLYKKQWSKCNSLCAGSQFIYPICVDLVNLEERPDNYCSASEHEIHVQKKSCNDHCQLQWTVSSYGPCSANCGEGFRNVYYTCMKINLANQQHQVVDDKHCSILPPASSTETCHGRCDATRWEYSSWTECSATCGGGTQARHAKCVDSLTHNTIDHIHCNQSDLTTQQICNGNKCPLWKVREWSACSASCGKGHRSATGFYCHLDGRLFDESACDPSTRPATQECIERHCYSWITGPWSGCSASCGTGTASRSVLCQVNGNQTISDKFCAGAPKPTGVKQCKVFDCYYERKWVAEKWSECSRECNGGTATRRVFCVNVATGREESAEYCSKHEEPKSFQQCNMHSCPTWSTENWTSCDRNCEKTRLVSCRNHLGDYVNDSLCSTNKPSTILSCKQSECKREVVRRHNRYQWKQLGAWRACTSFCGRGQKRRTIQCQDSYNNVTLVDQYCSHLPKPKVAKKCERYNCKVAWIEGPWSQCSSQCGRGHRTRNVTCHQVFQRRIVDPRPMVLHRNRAEEYCNLFHKPVTTMACNEQHCNEVFVWRTGPWSECSQECGKKGRQVRDVFCVYRNTNERVAKSRCTKGLRPKRKIKCNQWRCMFRSCKDVQRRTGSRTNREYTMTIRKKVARIYCYKMDTNEPEEYISLEGDAINFAENYHMRLKNPNWCPYDGQRIENCDCLNIGPERSGFTTFWKIRLNITSLRIIGEDFTFSRQEMGDSKIPYGTAGDCYSSIKSCSQGRFSIDLSGTSFELTRNVNWRNIGTNATSYINVEDGKRVMGRCGGYCGNCVPDLLYGLEVDIT